MNKTANASTVNQDKGLSLNAVEEVIAPMIKRLKA